jgi:diguanylate cyclase (GGDEF)-like protein
VSFRRRLAVFFVLLVIVPMVAMLSILLFISEDARRGKADARLASGLETALALYGEQLADGRAAARALAASPETAGAVAGDQRARLRALVSREIASGEAVAVQVLDTGGTELAAAGPADAIAFGEVSLVDDGQPMGSLRVSTIAASTFAQEVKRLTKRELVVSRERTPLAQTVAPPRTLPEVGDTVDLQLAEGEYRARQQALDTAAGEAVLLLGPSKEGGFLTIGRPAAALLAAFLLIAVVLAWSLTRRLSALHERVADLAVTDPLTRVWNRRRMGELLERESERLRRFGHPFSFLIVDVDDFKSINDLHGHPQGDDVLTRLAEIIESETRTIDETIRFGGDELALVLSETGPEGAAVLAERLRARVAAETFPLAGGGQMRTTVSVGAASAPDCAGEIDDLVQAADQALLTSKRRGKDRVVSAPMLREHSPA